MLNQVADMKVLSLFNDKMKKTAMALQKAKDKKDKKRTSSSKDRTFGFCAVVKTPKKIYNFLKKHCQTDDTSMFHHVKSDGTTNLIEISHEMKRSDITTLLYWYCDIKKLKNENDKRIITPDKELRTLFGKALKKDEHITFSNFQTKLKVLFDEDTDNKKSKQV